MWWNLPPGGSGAAVLWLAGFLRRRSKWGWQREGVCRPRRELVAEMTLGQTVRDGAWGSDRAAAVWQADPPGADLCR